MSIMTMHTLMRMIRDRKYPNAVDFVTEVNQRLSDNDIVRDQGGFITLLYCMLDTRTNRLQWSSAGHPMPMLQNLDTNEVTVLGDEDSSGLPLGIDGKPARVLAADFYLLKIDLRRRCAVAGHGLHEAERKLLNAFDECLRERAFDAFMHEDALSADAQLPGIRERSAHCDVCSFRDVYIRHDDA